MLQSQTVTNGILGLRLLTPDEIQGITPTHINSGDAAAAVQGHLSSQSSTSNQYSALPLQQNETPLIPTPGTKLYTLTPADVEHLAQQGYDPATLPKQVLVESDAGRAEREKQSKSTTHTPADLKNATICLDTFLGMTNQMLLGDVVTMKAEALKFRFNDQDWEYSGHYTIVLNIPRKHRNPYLSFGSPDKAKIVILDDFNGESLPLPDATIWQKSNGFIDLEAVGKEWIYSGTYTIQN